MATKRRKIKFGKIAIVVSLTVLIWVWADLALDETPPARKVTIIVDEEADKELWVSFSEKPQIEIQVTLSGPHSAFVALDNRLRAKGTGLEIRFNAAKESIIASPGGSLKVLDFLQKADEFRKEGIKVESCEPATVDVNVVALTEKTLPVECFDEDGAPQKTESSPSVKMFVPEDVRTARVTLSRQEQIAARAKSIEKIPYVVLAENWTRHAKTPVKIKLPPPSDPLTEDTIKAPQLGMAFSDNLQGKYTVEITNLNEVRSPIKIKATAAAKQAYEGMRYQIILEIDDEDIKEAEPRRQLKYNFPEEFVRTDEIRINQPPVQARFKVKAVSASSENL